MNPAPTEDQKTAALNALQALSFFFSDTTQLTEDELKALGVLREALESITAGEDLNPPEDGAPLKMRLVRRIEFRFFHPLAPRPRTLVQDPRAMEEVKPDTLD